MRVLVAGGGIGGLATALGLLRAGFDVTVVEQAAELREVGAGLTLSTGAMRSLDLLGVADEVEGLIARTPAFPFLHYASGAVLVPGRAPAGPLPRLAKGHVLRAELHALLARAVRARSPKTIMLGRRVTGVEQSSDGVTLLLDGGGALHGDMLVGADGVRSAVRASLFGDDDPSFTGRVAYRFLLPAPVGRPFLDAGTAASYVGVGRTFNRYLVGGGTVLNCVGLATTDRWSAEGWSHPATRAELLAEFDGWHPDVLALMEQAPDDSLIRWGIFQRKPRSTWSDGRVVLLGDAAHPMLPFLGLGAAMAIEDAAILARACAEFDGHTDAIAHYEAARIPRATRMFEESERQGEVFDTIDPAHYGKVGAPAQDEAMRDYHPELVML